jgi:hypothetical protein
MSGQEASQREVADEEVYELFEDTDDPVISTLEIADSLPVRRWKTREKLREMARENKLEYKVFTPDLTVWWRKDD